MRHSDNCEARGGAAGEGDALLPTQPHARFVLRTATADDGAALAHLWVATWAETMPAIDFAARRPFIEAVLADPATLTLVAAAGAAPSEPLGFASLAGGTLHQLAVAPEVKGGGAASALLDAAKARSPGGLVLQVNQANARAVRFYRREGFAIAGDGRNPTSGLATWHMRWRPRQVPSQVPRQADGDRPAAAVGAPSRP